MAGRIVKRGAILPLGVDEDGKSQWAVPGFLASAYDAAQYPGQVYRGEKQVMDPATGRVSDEAIGKGFDLAGSAMLGSAPMSVPRGALRSFGGVADDSLSALEKALANVAPETPLAPRGAAQLDPAAKSWDLYHGSTGGTDFKRFDPNFGKAEGNTERGALFFAAEPETAGFYAGGTGAGQEAGPRVFRTKVEPGKTKVFDVADMVANDPTFGERARNAMLAERTANPSPAEIARADSLRDAYRSDFMASRARDAEINAQLVEYGLEPTQKTGATYGHGYLGAAIAMAKEQGLDTAVLRGLAEHEGVDQVIALTPGRVRSHYTNELLYSNGPSGAGAGFLSGSQQQQAEKPMSGGVGFMGRQPLGNYYAGLEARHGLPAGFLARTRAIESANGTNLRNPNSSAGGDFQFLDKTAAGIGLKDKFDPYQSADAAARLAAQNKAMIVKATGKEPTGADLYVAHQQGPKGYLDLTRGQTTGSAEMALNGGAGKSAGGFLSMWRDKFNNAKPANLGEGYVTPPVQGGNAGQGPTVQAAAGLPPAPVTTVTPAAPVNPATDSAYKGGLLGLFGVGDQSAAGMGKDTLAKLGDMAAQPGGGALGGLATAVSRFAAPTQQQAAGITLQAPADNVHTGDPSLMAYLDPRRRRAAMMGA